MSARKTIGFGCPEEIDPHYFVVEIPVGRADDVVIIEHFGLLGGSNGIPEYLERCRLTRSAWRAIAEEAKRVLNERLKEKKLATSRWTTGANKVERLLGKELCVLAWSVENASENKYPFALKSWVELRPEERWWLFYMAAAATGTSDDADIGWRKAIRIAFTENPSQLEMYERRQIKSRKKKPRAEDRPPLPLFEHDK